ncbi:MAG: hypothetical protein U0531_10370 [Dehalococcoidia bacterium]
MRGQTPGIFARDLEAAGGIDQHELVVHDLGAPAVHPHPTIDLGAGAPAADRHHTVHTGGNVRVMGDDDDRHLVDVLRLRKTS